MTGQLSGFANLPDSMSVPPTARHGGAVVNWEVIRDLGVALVRCSPPPPHEPESSSIPSRKSIIIVAMRFSQLEKHCH
jgi:hypothetical protein